MLGRAPPNKDRVATELIPMDKWVQELCIAQEEAWKLILANIKSEQQDQVESTLHWLRTWEAGNYWGVRVQVGCTNQERCSVKDLEEERDNFILKGWG